MANSMRPEFRFAKETAKTFESAGFDTTYVIFSEDKSDGTPNFSDYVLLAIINWKVAPKDACKAVSLTVGADGQGIAFDANADFDFHTLDDVMTAAREAGPHGGGGGDPPVNIGGKPHP
jgi:hypothetical protein